MPKFRVTQLSFIGNSIVQPGEVVEFDGLPSENLEPLDAPAEAATASAANAAAESMARQKAAAVGASPDQVDVVAATSAAAAAAETVIGQGATGLV